MKSFVAFVFLVFASLMGYAGTIEWVNVLEASELSVGTEFELFDASSLDEDANPALYKANRRNEVRLVYGREDQSDVDGNKWDLTVHFRVSFLGQNVLPVYDSLRIAQDTGEHLYEAVRVYANGGKHVKVKILGVDFASQNLAAIPSDVRLELRTFTERYAFLDGAEQVDLGYDANAQKLFWTRVRGAEEYELEWCWVDGASSAAGADFGRAVRISTAAQWYFPDLSYREGTVYFRVRPVGRFINGVGADYSYKKYGAWSSVVSHGIQNGFEADKNYVFSTTYTEEGKYKKVVQYSDGLGRGRQALVNLSTDSTTVVSQTEYDHEGRGVLNTIPVPVAGTDLGYRDALNNYNATDIYEPQHFDDQAITSPLHPFAGAARYFSPNNNTGGIHRDYVPDAEGYPFSQVEFRRDATGRIARQGGAGPDHQLNSGHEVQFFYGDATSAELHRMFGGNVGDASHYLKKMTVDPNGQVSFAWQTQEGQVIATCLAGDVPLNLVDDGSAVAISVTESLNSDTQIDTVAGISTTQHTFTNGLRNQNYSFHYDMSGVIDQISCVCTDCEYALEITVMGPDQSLVPLGSYGLVLRDTFSAGGQTCPVWLHQGTVDFTAVFADLGDYQLRKTLRVIPVDEEALLDSLSACPDFPQLSDYLDSTLAEIDSTLCGTDCNTFGPFWFNTDTGPPVVGNGTTLDSCNGAVFVDSSMVAGIECASIYQQMWADVSPGGWLYDSVAYANANGDSLQIDALVRDHREWCHYDFCLEFAQSRVYDIHGASVGTMSEAVTNGLILDPADCPSPAVADQNDPFFNSHPSPYWGDMRLALCTDPYLGQSPGYPGIMGIFDPNNPAVAPLYAGCTTTACEDSVRWQLTRGAYLNTKMGLVAEHVEDSLACPYWNDGRAIVVRPQMPEPSQNDPDNWLSYNTAVECNGTCGGNVSVWMETLGDSCANAGSPLSSADSLNIANALLVYCLSGCPNGNPMGLITDAALSNGELAAVAAILPAGCVRFLDSMAVPAPYTYVQNGDSIKVACTNWDPCLVTVREALNEAWSYSAFPGNIDLNGDPVAANCHAGAAELAVQNDHVNWTDAQGNALCGALALADGAGNVIGWDSVKFIDVPVYDPAALVAASVTVNGSSWAYQNVSATLYTHRADSSEGELAVYFYAPSACGYSVSQDSCLMPQIVVDSAWLVDLDPAAAYDSCIAQLVAEAQYQATQAWEAAVDEYLGDALATLNKRCWQAPFKEDFSVDFAPKLYQFTLYYYDQSGALVQTVPPEGVELLDNATTSRWVEGTADPVADQPPHRMATRYGYNALGQLLRSETPDGGQSQMWYNGKDQLRLSQDARQALGNDYAFTKYDALGRVTESGQLESFALVVEPAELDGFDFPDRANENLTDVVTLAYDSDGDYWQNNLRTRVVSTTKERTEGDTVAVSRFDYDDHGNVKRQRTEIYGLGEKELKYSYDLVSGNVKRVWYQDGKLDYFGHRYKYDADNRLTEVFTSKDNVFWDRDGRYRYYAHGPLARLEIGEDAVQGLDYFYTLQGWIKGMNMAGDVEGKFDPGEDGRDLAGGLNRWAGRDGAAFQLGFFEGEYTGIGNPSLGSGDNVWSEMGNEILGLNGQAKGLWNGNVPMMLTDLRFGPSGMKEAHGYAYKYDAVQRIKEAKSHEISTSGWYRVAGSNEYDASYWYDANGNLENLQRAMPNPNGSGGVLMDIFQYRYDLNASGKKENNKLRLVSDGAPANLYNNDLDNQGGVIAQPFSGRNYNYDAIGNLIADSTEMVDSIVWDLSGKILAVKRTAAGSAAGMADLAFGYDGSGNRVWKRSIASGDTTTTFYVRDAQAMPMAVYERVKGGGDSVLTYLKEWTIYGAERLGLDLAGKLVDVQTGDAVANPPMDGQRTLLVAEVMYDSPLAKDGQKNEGHEGEYVELVNVSGGSLDLAGISLLSTAMSESVDLSGSLEDGERLVLTYTEKAACNWPLSYVRKTAGKTLVCTDGWSLPDGGGAVEARRGSAVLDAVEYGKDAGLDAANGYSAAVADPVQAVRRWMYGYADTSALVGTSTFGYAAKQSVSVDLSTLEIEPVPVSGPSGGLFELARGGKVYEVSNHLGNVLAVVSDLKLGRRAVPNSAGGVDWYEPEVLSLSDYYPFGIEMGGRSFVSGRYRYGFNGQEHDDEFLGQGNSYAFRDRSYDPRLGRFNSLDPLNGSFPSNSPFSFADNGPIVLVDQFGAYPHVPRKALAVVKNRPQISHSDYVKMQQVLKEAQQLVRNTPKVPQPRNLAPMLFKRYPIVGIMIDSWERAEMMDDPKFWIERNFNAYERHQKQHSGAMTSFGESYQWGEVERYRDALMNSETTVITNEGYEVFTNDPSSLSDEYLAGVAQRMLSGNARPTDYKYAQEAQNRLSGALASGESPKFDIDHTFVEGVDNLAGEINLGGYDGGTIYAQISAINKNANYPGSVFENLTNKLEALGKFNNLEEVQIEFQLVVNSRLANDPSWAKKYGYYFHRQEGNSGVVNITWTKVLQNGD